METAHKILEAARKVFLWHGYDGARTQMIADQAQVSKAMLHYHFKDKETLYREVFEYAILQIKSGLVILNDSELTIQEKIEKFAKFCFHLYQNNADVMQFINTEIQRSRSILPNYILAQYNIMEMDISKQVQEGMRLGLIKKTNIQEILLLMLGLMLFPMISYDLNTSFMGFPKANYKEILEAYYEHLPARIMVLIKM